MLPMTSLLRSTAYVCCYDRSLLLLPEVLVVWLLLRLPPLLPLLLSHLPVVCRCVTVNVATVIVIIAHVVFLGGIAAAAAGGGGGGQAGAVSS